jgi:hypothetical protein
VVKDFMTFDGGSQALSALSAFSANGAGRAAEAQNCYGLGYRYRDISNGSQRPMFAPGAARGLTVLRKVAGSTRPE